MQNDLKVTRLHSALDKPTAQWETAFDTTIGTVMKKM